MKRVLIIDDAAFARTALRILLERNGFSIVGEAENGFSGVKKFRDLNPDIVTMDLTMPDMDGIEAIKEIKKLNDNAKIVVVSAMGQEVHIREAVMSGAKNFIVKPFKEEFVIKALNML